MARLPDENFVQGEETLRAIQTCLHHRTLLDGKLLRAKPLEQTTRATRGMTNENTIVQVGCGLKEYDELTYLA